MKTSELAKLLGGILHGDEAREVHQVAALATAGPDDLTYAEGAKFLDLAAGFPGGVYSSAGGLPSRGPDDDRGREP